VSRGAASGVGDGPGEELTTTSYAILGLLALRPWSTYELAQQMSRSMRLWWPRAESRVYEEPKRLARLGLATVRDEGVGRRPRSVYRITTAGRKALEEWLGEPPSPFRMEFEAMLKVFFADQGTREQLLGNIASVREWAEGELERGRGFYASYLADGGPFPERLHVIALATDLYERLLRAAQGWADDAERAVEQWPSTREAPDPTDEFHRRLGR
jgi:DNA-binding PadR family transcriptional regulator